MPAPVVVCSSAARTGHRPTVARVPLPQFPPATPRLDAIRLLRGPTRRAPVPASPWSIFLQRSHPDPPSGRPTTPPPAPLERPDRPPAVLRHASVRPPATSC